VFQDAVRQGVDAASAAERCRHRSLLLLSPRCILPSRWRASAKKLSADARRG
jgi:hypothetical protein